MFAIMFFSCSGMMDDIKPYLDEGETIYVGKLDSIRIFSGHNRIRIEGMMPYGATQVKCAISWIDPFGETGSKEFDVVRGDLDEVYQFMLEDLVEGQYDFTIVTKDSYNHSSIKVEIGGYSYGDVYQSSLVNRPIDGIESGAVQWRDMNNDEVQGCNLEYELDNDGGFKQLYVPVSDQSTSIDDYKPNGILYWNTVYLPDSTAIDKFYTEKAQLSLPSNQ
jgi:hypothetical protein